eukprot:7391750-Prymnesium_polylepis.3
MSVVKAARQVAVRPPRALPRPAPARRGARTTGLATYADDPALTPRGSSNNSCSCRPARQGVNTGGKFLLLLRCKSSYHVTAVSFG